jgi:predicted alpha/beta hydrolase family esterase
MSSIHRYGSGGVARSFLILHGYLGSGPDHWQTWLAGRLRDAGETVAYPDLPSPAQPELAAWSAALDAALAGLAGPPIVIAHSLACILWLHHGAAAERVLLVAPPSLAGAPEPIRGFFPAPLDRPLGDARLVCSDHDPYCPEGAPAAYPLGIPVDVLPGAGHINPDAGFGPWPEAEAWCYGASAIASSRIAPG